MCVGAPKLQDDMMWIPRIQKGIGFVLAATELCNCRSGQRRGCHGAAGRLRSLRGFAPTAARPDGGRPHGPSTTSPANCSTFSTLHVCRKRVHACNLQTHRPAILQANWLSTNFSPTVYELFTRNANLLCSNFVKERIWSLSGLSWPLVCKWRRHLSKRKERHKWPTRWHP